MMNKTYGVCLGLLALGLVGLGAPASRAQSRLAAGEAGGGSETAATSAASSSSSPTASSPADLRQRIDALKAELADLNTELAAEKDGDSATSAAAPQDQGAPLRQRRQLRPHRCLCQPRRCQDRSQRGSRMSFPRARLEKLK